MKINLSFILAVICCILQAQPIQVTLSKSGFSSDDIYFGQNEHSLYYHSNDKESNVVTVKEFSKETLELLSETKVTKPIDVMGKVESYQFMIVKENIYCVQSYFYDRNDKLSLYAYPLNKNGQLGEKILIAEKSGLLPADE